MFDARTVQVLPGGELAIRTTATLEGSDIEIGAVELKDGITDNRAEIDATGALKVQGTFSPVENATIVSALKTIAATGVAEPIVAVATLVNSVVITALVSNTEPVSIGGSTVDIATNPGTQLYPGSSVEILIDDANKIYADVTVNGEGISFNLLS